MSELELFPLNTTRDTAGHVIVGGCDVVWLAAEFDTPLYIFDEATLRAYCRAYLAPLRARYANSSITYAGKAYLDPTILRIASEEGLGLDAVSGGEITLALAAGFPAEDIVFHGNNKLPDEIALALDAGVGKFAVDGEDDLRTLAAVAQEKNLIARVMLRLTPGISAHTHEYIRTGMLDSKFGIPISTGDAERVVRLAMDCDGIELIGYHAHIGSQIFDVQPLADNATALVEFALEMEERHGAEFSVLSPGGGGGVRYVETDDGIDIGTLVGAIIDAVRAGLPAGREPEIILEPGRSIVARAGVALYTVGTVKTIPGVRTYVAVDGGMADNIRPALYQAEYTAVLAGRAGDGPAQTVTVAGRYCETGDILIKDIDLPVLRQGDLLAIPTAGAYTLSMASNYNLALRPAVVVVNEGDAQISRRRETYDDLLACFP